MSYNGEVYGKKNGQFVKLSQGLPSLTKLCDAQCLRDSANTIDSRNDAEELFCDMINDLLGAIDALVEINQHFGHNGPGKDVIRIGLRDLYRKLEQL